MSRPRTARAAAPALALFLPLLLAGCPIPQTLPDYPTTGAIAPPRLQSDLVTPVDTVLEVAANCATPPSFVLTASAVYDDTTKPFDARWFVDYRPDRPQQARDQHADTIPAPTNGVDIVRPIPAWTFAPYGFDPGADAAAQQAFRDGGGLHVVELVVSNGFAAGDGPAERPFRSPAPNFETQLHRWVFQYRPAGSGGSCGYPAP